MPQPPHVSGRRREWLGNLIAFCALGTELATRAAVERLDGRRWLPLALCAFCSLVAVVAGCHGGVLLSRVLPCLWVAAWLASAFANAEANTSALAVVVCVIPALQLSPLTGSRTGAVVAVAAEGVLLAVGVLSRAVWPYTDIGGEDSFLAQFMPFCIIAVATLLCAEECVPSPPPASAVVPAPSVEVDNSVLDTTKDEGSKLRNSMSVDGTEESRGEDQPVPQLIPVSVAGAGAKYAPRHSHHTDRSSVSTQGLWSVGSGTPELNIQQLGKAQAMPKIKTSLVNSNTNQSLNQSLQVSPRAGMPMSQSPMSAPGDCWWGGVNRVRESGRESFGDDLSRREMTTSYLDPRRVHAGLWSCLLNPQPLYFVARTVEREASTLCSGTVSCALWVTDPDRRTFYRATVVQRGMAATLRRGSSRRRSLSIRRASRAATHDAPEVAVPEERLIAGPGVIAACIRGDIAESTEMKMHPLFERSIDGARHDGYTLAIPVPHPGSEGLAVGCLVVNSTSGERLQDFMCDQMRVLCQLVSEPLYSSISIGGLNHGQGCWKALAEAVVNFAGEPDLMSLPPHVSEQGKQVLGLQKCVLWVKDDDDHEGTAASVELWTIGELGQRQMMENKGAKNPVIRAFLSGENVLYSDKSKAGSQPTPRSPRRTEHSPSAAAHLLTPPSPGRSVSVVSDVQSQAGRGSIQSLAIPLISPVPGSTRVIGVLDMTAETAAGAALDFLERSEVFACGVSGAIDLALRMKAKKEEGELLIRLVHVVNVLGHTKELAPFTIVLQQQIRNLVDCDAVRVFLVARDGSYAEHFHREDGVIRTIATSSKGPLCECMMLSKVQHLRAYCNVEDAQSVITSGTDFGPSAIHSIVLVPIFDEDGSVMAVVSMANRRVLKDGGAPKAQAESPASSAPSSPRRGLVRSQGKSRLPPGYGDFKTIDVRTAEMVCFNVAGRLSQLLGEEAASARGRIRGDIVAVRRKCRVVDVMIYPLTPGVPSPPLVPEAGAMLMQPPRSLFAPLSSDEGLVWGVLQLVDDSWSDARRQVIADYLPNISVLLTRSLGPLGRRGLLDSAWYRSFVESVAPWMPRKDIAYPKSPGEATPKEKKAEGKIVWRKGQLLGRGAFGTVHLAQNAGTGELMAVKTVVFNPADTKVWKRLQQLQSEIGLMKRLSHPAVVAYVGTERDGNEVHIFMEYVPGGSVADNLNQFGAFSTETSASYTRSMLSGLEYLHTQDPPVIHRDIKGANVLITRSGVAKLADLGSAALDEGGDLGMQGTPLWMPPEVITNSPISTTSDVWSLGCTVVEMVTGKAPFMHVAPTQMQVLNFIIDEDEDIEQVFPPDYTAPPEVFRFVMSCLQRDCSDRPSASELLEDDWLASLPGDRGTPKVQEIDVGVPGRQQTFADMSHLVDLKARRSQAQLATLRSVSNMSVDSELQGFASPTASNLRVQGNPDAELVMSRIRSALDEAVSSTSDPTIRAWAEQVLNSVQVGLTPSPANLQRSGQKTRAPSFKLEGSTPIRRLKSGANVNWYPSLTSPGSPSGLPQPQDSRGFKPGQHRTSLISVTHSESRELVQAEEVAQIALEGSLPLTPGASTGRSCTRVLSKDRRLGSPPPLTGI
eukprot:Hpha_TRINITY_DN8802_c0_g1::TRINITY_DN8802_c0_g1_i1::g.141355::m.141355